MVGEHGEHIIPILHSMEHSKKETANILANIGDHQAYDGDYQPGELEEAGTFIW